MSRSVLAQRFTELVGEAPMRDLAGLADAAREADDARRRAQHPGRRDPRRLRVRSGLQPRFQARNGLTTGSLAQGSGPAAIVEWRPNPLRTACPHARISRRAASTVPATRARIFWNAMSRDVDASSANGAKPQSSVVPATRRVYSRRRAESGPAPVRLFQQAGRSVGHANKGDLIRPEVLANDLRAHASGLFARQLDIETSHPKLKQRREQTGIVDIGAVRRVSVTAGRGMYTYPPLLLWRKVIEDAVVQRDKVSEPGGRIEFE